MMVDVKLSKIYHPPRYPPRDIQLLQDQFELVYQDSDGVCLEVGSEPLGQD